MRKLKVKMKCVPVKRVDEGAGNRMSKRIDKEKKTFQKHRFLVGFTRKTKTKQNKKTDQALQEIKSKSKTCIHDSQSFLFFFKWSLRLLQFITLAGCTVRAYYMRPINKQKNV